MEILKFFSLPKIIGSISGGLLVTKDKNFSKFCNIEQKKNKNLGVYQSFQNLSLKTKKIIIILGFIMRAGILLWKKMLY